MWPFEWLARRRENRAYQQLLDGIAVALAEGRHAEAGEACARALAIAEARYGADHAELTTPLYALASAELAGGQVERADASCRRAITIAEAAPAATEPPLPRLLEQLAAILERQGNAVEVEALLRRVIAGYERMRDPDKGELAAALTRLGLALGKKGERDEAEPLFARALALREAAFGPEHLLVAEALHNAATFRPASAPAATAEAMFRRALAIVPVSRERAALRATILHNLAAACEEQQRPAEAAPLYEEALTLKEALVGPDAAELRPTLVRLARLQQAAGHLETAAGLYARALALARIELGEEHAIPQAIAAWQAECVDDKPRA